jgi:hypothetical protein
MVAISYREHILPSDVQKDCWVCFTSLSEDLEDNPLVTHQNGDNTHPLHKKCAVNLVKNGFFTCSVCQLQINPRSVVTLEELTGLVQQLQSQKAGRIVGPIIDLVGQLTTEASKIEDLVIDETTTVIRAAFEGAIGSLAGLTSVGRGALLGTQAGLIGLTGGMLGSSLFKVEKVGLKALKMITGVFLIEIGLNGVRDGLFTTTAKTAKKVVIFTALGWTAKAFGASPIQAGTLASAIFCIEEIIHVRDVAKKQELRVWIGATAGMITTSIFAFTALFEQIALERTITTVLGVQIAGIAGIVANVVNLLLFPETRTIGIVEKLIIGLGGIIIGPIGGVVCTAPLDMSGFQNKIIRVLVSCMLSGTITSVVTNELKRRKFA